MIHIPNMFMIGSTGRNSGKTTLAAAMVQKFKSTRTVIGLKVTSIEGPEEACPRGGLGCGACGSLVGSFQIIEETDKNTAKDTSQLLASGCAKVFWLKTLRTHLAEGITEFLKLVPPDAIIICESNSLRHVVQPKAFIMLDNEKDTIKDTAKSVIDLADTVIREDIRTCADMYIPDII